MSKIDKTRENIKITRLKDNERKDLFDKFIKSGGEVIKERKKVKIKIDRSKQREFSQKMDDHYRKSKSNGSFRRSNSSSNDDPQSGNKKKGNKNKSFIGRFVDNIIINVKLKFLGVTDIHGFFLNPKFLDRIDMDYKTALMELQMIYLDVFKQYPNKGAVIMDKLDDMKPLYVELIELSADFFDRTTISQLLDNYIAFPGELQKTVDIKEPLMSLFRKLYVLYLYQTQTLLAFEKAIDLQMRINKGKSSVYSAKKKKVKNNLYIIYNKLFPRLYWLFCSFNNEIVPLGDSFKIEELLSITDEMKPGNRVPHTHNNYTPGIGKEAPTVEKVKEKSVENEEKKKQQPTIPQDVKRGLDALNKLNLDELRNKFIQNENIKKIVESDKVLIAYLLFREFDFEYTFLLTTNKIKYNVFFDKKGKVDFREKLADLYNEMRKPVNSINEYFDFVEMYESIREERPTSNEQYYQYTKRLSKLENEKSEKGNEALYNLKVYMQKISETLCDLIEDMDKDNKIINNPQDVIEIDPAIEGDKKLSNKKVFQAISIVNDYAAAFAYRLSSKGDLIKSSEKSTSTSDEVLPLIEKDEEDQLQKNKNSENTGSILGELDDLI